MAGFADRYLPKWSFLVCNASALFMPLIVTLFIAILFSLFSQIGFLSRFEKENKKLGRPGTLSAAMLFGEKPKSISATIVGAGGVETGKVLLLRT